MCVHKTDFCLGTRSYSTCMYTMCTYVYMYTYIKALSVMPPRGSPDAVRPCRRALRTRCAAADGDAAKAKSGG